ncbi:hypothetical protein TorRG33x02_027920 [Trema orientale]|uniref:Uncharacterized protein n=1 Tax=Trema orientale TaxID=63057 RepID=A0A2P5FUN1_TREOI|nr:hypothetical protein TorRG33x02_027920 [Trema orientale]
MRKIKKARSCRQSSSLWPLPGVFKQFKPMFSDKRQSASSQICCLHKHISQCKMKIPHL